MKCSQFVVLNQILVIRIQTKCKPLSGCTISCLLHKMSKYLDITYTFEAVTCFVMFHVNRSDALSIYSVLLGCYQF